MSLILHLLQLRFAVLSPIKQLPHYHGPQWSALFRHLLRESSTNSPGPADASVLVQPIETGITEYQPGEFISLGIAFEHTHAPAIQQLLSGFNSLAGSGKGHFQPGVTVRLESSISRRTSASWAASDSPLDQTDLEPEIEELCRLDHFSIATISPLRLPRPPEEKTSGHEYCDADFFLVATGNNPAAHLLRRLADRQSIDFECGLAVVGGYLTWHDISYGAGAERTTFGGAVGMLEIKGPPTRREAEWLVRGQYCGVGKNRAFGLGFYRIPQLDAARRILPLSRSTTLFSRAVADQNLATALAALPDSAPGPDRMPVSDARAAGTPLLRSIRDHALAGPASGPVALLGHGIPKPLGGQRTIYLQNVKERILHRAFANELAPSLDGLLSNSAYAYRRGLSRHNAAATLQRLLAEGYEQGLKADIASFFDSVDVPDLWSGSTRPSR